MVKNKKILLSLITAFTLTTSANATWKTWADGNVAMYSSGAKSIKTQLTTSYSGGSIRVRWGDLGAVKLVNVSMPSFDVGCNGIDTNFGGFSFLNFDVLVEKLKNIAAAAPAFAFKMAINTVCSQCATIMQDLEEIIDEINSMSLDACGLSQDIGGFVGKSIGDGINTLIGKGKYEDGSEAQREIAENKPSFLKEAWEGLKDNLGVTFASKSKGYGSLLENAFNDYKSFGGLNTKFIKTVIRPLAGDVTFIIDSEGNDTERPFLSIQTLDELIDAFVFNGGKYVTVSAKLKGENGDAWEIDNGDRPVKVTYTQDTVEIKKDETWSELIYVKLEDIVTSLQNKEDLTNDQKETIINLPLNIIDIINAKVAGSTSSTINLKNVSEYIALLNIKEALRITLKKTRERIGSYLSTTTNDGTEQNKLILKRYLDLSKELTILLKDLNNDIKKYLNKNGLTNILEEISKAKLEMRKDGMNRN